MPRMRSWKDKEEWISGWCTTIQMSCLQTPISISPQESEEATSTSKRVRLGSAKFATVGQNHGPLSCLGAQAD